jgi:diacylglycerol kinase
MSFIHSVQHALRGMKIVFQEERNFRMQILAAVAITGLMFMFRLSLVEKGILFLLIAIVLILEMMNSILERFIDILKPRIHSYAKDMKDIAAGAVFVSSVTAVIVGVIIFYPRIYDLIKNAG